MATRIQMPDEVVHQKDGQPHRHFRDEHHHHPQATHPDPVELTSGLGHQMSPTDPENPQNWSVYKKIYTSLVAIAFAFAVAFALTIYTAGLSQIIARFNVSMTVAILGFSIYLVGIAFAPIYTPHLSERYGRRIVYFVSLPLCAMFLIGTGASQSFAALAVCRFFAGFAGGPCLVLIEGTFADMWSPAYTVTYYSFLTLASYIGAACGPLVGGFVVTDQGWRWTSWVPLMLIAVVYAFGGMMPETYPREILRRRARKAGVPHKLPKAQSGVTLGEMAQLTIIQPVIMLFIDPITLFSTLYVAFIFGTVFQWFIAVPPVLSKTYNFTLDQAGLAFIAAIGGAILAAASSILIERVAYPREVKKSGHKGIADIEYRFLPAAVGSIFVTVALFWIGWTAKPSVSWASPVLGTGLFVWGNVMVLISIISYLFDAFPPPATLSALTIAASMRLLVAAAIPLVIIQDITRLGGGWAYSIFGFIAAALMILPYAGYRWGSEARAKSKYNKEQMMAMGEKMAEHSDGSSSNDAQMMMSHSDV